MNDQSAPLSSQPTPPRRSTSLKRRSRKRDSTKLASLVPDNGDIPASSTDSSNNGMHDDDDDIVYVVRRDVISIRVPMETATDLIPFHQLPKEAQLRPTDTLTWARQTPHYLYLETIVPPQCKVCLANLQGDHTEPKAVAVPVIPQKLEPEPLMAAAPTILQAAPTVNAPFYFDGGPTNTSYKYEEEQKNASNNYEEGQTPFVESYENMPTSPGGDQYYGTNSNSNAATPALLIPGNFTWAS